MDSATVDIIVLVSQIIRFLCSVTSALREERAQRKERRRRERHNPI